VPELPIIDAPQSNYRAEAAALRPRPAGPNVETPPIDIVLPVRRRKICADVLGLRWACALSRTSGGQVSVWNLQPVLHEIPLISKPLAAA
jgi:hypothetical protein